MSHNQTQGGPKSTAPAGQRARRLNLRALIALAVVAAVGVPAFFGARALQDARRRDGLLREARLQADAGQPDRALKFVGEYLRLRPEDADALDLRAELLADSARSAAHLDEAIRASERVLRLDPDGDGRQETRRRLARLYLEMERFAHPADVKYQTAKSVVRELIDRAGRPGAGGPRAEDYRLLGRVLEGQATHLQGGPEVLAAAVAAYRRALELEPGDVEGTERLAELHRRAGDAEAADAVLRGLVAADPTPAAYLALYRHHTRAGDRDRAAADLAEAVRLGPVDPEARLAAARAALTRNDLTAARAHLDALPAAAREGIAARVLEGTIELQANDLDDAVESWRLGLLQSGGTDADLTWWLAYVLLQLGRPEEAAPLIGQFYRLVGREEPTPELRLLDALRLLRTGQAAKALGRGADPGEGADPGANLEIIRLRVAEPLRPQANLVLGQCYEAVHDIASALEAYRRAAQLAPSWSTPRLAVVRLLRDDPSDPDAAGRELASALAEYPDDPGLLIARAEAAWRSRVEKIPGGALLAGGRGPARPGRGRRPGFAPRGPGPRRLPGRHRPARRGRRPARPRPDRR